MKKFLNSSYTKAALVLLVCGGILIAFNKWISTTKFSAGFDAIHDTLAPVYIGIVCAFLLCPLYNGAVAKVYSIINSGNQLSEGKCELDTKKNRRKLTTSRVIGTIVSMLILIGVGAFVIYNILPQTITSIIDLFSNLPERLVGLSAWLEKNFKSIPQLSKWVAQLAAVDTQEIFDWVQVHLLADQSATTLAEAVSTGVLSFFGAVMDVFVGLVITVFLLNYKETLFAIGRKLVAAIFSEEKQRNIFEFTGIVNDTFVNFIIGRIIDSAIIGLLTYVCMMILNMPFASMISVVVGVTNVIPFFGPFIGAIPSVLILMLEDPHMALIFIIMIFLIQQLDGNVIGPKIVGDALGLSSFWILIAVLIGGGLFGFVGMALGVPIFAVIYKYIDKLATRSLENKGEPTSSNDYYSLDAYGIKCEHVYLEDIKKTPRKERKKKKEQVKQEKEEAEKNE